MSNQDNIPPSGASNPSVTDTQEKNLTAAKYKDVKIAILKMFKAIKKELNKCFNEDWQYKRFNETMKAIHDMKVEFIKEIVKPMKCKRK